MKRRQQNSGPLGRAIICALTIVLIVALGQQIVFAQVVYFDQNPRQAVDPFERLASYSQPAANHWGDNTSENAFSPPPAQAMPDFDVMATRGTLAVNGSSPRPYANDPIQPISHVVQEWPVESEGEEVEYLTSTEMLDDIWTWQLMPQGLFYRSYLAGIKEPRLGTQVQYEQDLGTQFDSTLGGRVGLIRFGNRNMYDPHGWQLDFEGAAMLRQDFTNELDVVATDFRAGVPLTYANGPYRMKISYYHLSSHLGDELIERTGAVRINYSRDVIVWGHSFYVTPDWRVYFEAGYAFAVDEGAEPWEFQFGAEYSPACTTDFCGVPFFAINAHLREEVDFGGNLVLEAGRQWRSIANGPTTRLGLFYYNGKSPQFEFFDHHEHQIGLGLWYDF